MAPKTSNLNAAVSPSLGVDKYVVVSTPLQEKPLEGLFEDADEVVTVKRILYSSVYLVLLLVLQFGWSISQLNLSTFHSKDDCDARPVPEGKCLIFPGHSSSQWSTTVNGWIVGGMIGSLSSGSVADRIGRRPTLMVNAIIVIIGSVLQASSQSVLMLAGGRFISGIAAGASSSIANTFINEVSPPHIRDPLGVLYQCAVGLGIFLYGITFFFANTSSGWRFTAGFPVVFAIVFLLSAPRLMVESPTWLLSQGRRDDAKAEIARLYGHHNVQRALGWMNAADAEQHAEHGESQLISVDTGDVKEQGPFKALFTRPYRMQTVIGVTIAMAQQLSGINAVFFYSSSIFKDAGVTDDRIGTIIVDVVALATTVASSGLGVRFGSRNMLLAGHGVMLLSAVGVTVSLLATISWLSIVFTALYVIGFAISLGPFAFVVAASLFPNNLRATGISLCLCVNWIGTLMIGIGYPYIADALNDWGFAPFVAMLALSALFLVVFLPDTQGKTNDEIQTMFATQS